MNVGLPYVNILLLLKFVLLSFVTKVSGFSSPSPSSSSSTELKELLLRARESKKALPLIGVHDALSARIIQDVYDQNHKHVALFVSGFGVSAAKSLPDAGIWTRNDLADTVQQISLLHRPTAIVESSSSTPQARKQQKPLIIADGDTGFGGTATIRHLIRQMTSLDVAAITIEDQVFPKRCTYAAMGGVTVVDRHDASKRIQTVLAARDEVYERTGQYISIIARTDCRRQLGLDEAIARCVDFEKLGGDIVYAENLKNIEEYTQLRSTMSNDTLMMLAQVQNNGSAEHQKHWTLDEIGAMGYEMGLYGVTGLQAVVTALKKVANELIQGDGLINLDEDVDDDHATNSPLLASLPEIKAVVGFDDLDAFEEKHNCI